MDNILTKTVDLRINLNIDGRSTSSKSHTHPSPSQVSRLLTSSLFLGVQVPYSTQYESWGLSGTSGLSGNLGKTTLRLNRSCLNLFFFLFLILLKSQRIILLKSQRTPPEVLLLFSTGTV